jgi:spore maturation protein CgeB
MRIVMFYHSLLSDWNHGNAHFLRGVAGELIFRGHDVTILAPRDSWSLQNLRAEHGEQPIADFHAAYPSLHSEEYELSSLDLPKVLDQADVVIVHEWNDPELIRRIGAHHAMHGSYRLLFHDTHHRAVTDPDAMARFDLRYYDGVLAFGEMLRRIYLERGWTARAWTWHEAADTRLFRPLAGRACEGDLVWIGNWGDEERSVELHEFLLEPVRELGLKARVHGVRYPEHARRALTEAGIEYAGWLPNFRVPEVFARFKVTVHVPRRPYSRALPGIPTIRPFEAMACGIAMISAPWKDAEHLFTPGEDYLVARNGSEMRQHLRTLLDDAEGRRAQASHAHQTILARHTCAHRVDQLLDIVAELNTPGRSASKRRIKKRTNSAPRRRRGTLARA